MRDTGSLRCDPCQKITCPHRLFGTASCGFLPVFFQPTSTVPWHGFPHALVLFCKLQHDAVREQTPHRMSLCRIGIGCVAARPLARVWRRVLLHVRKTLARTRRLLFSPRHEWRMRAHGVTQGDLVSTGNSVMDGFCFMRTGPGRSIVREGDLAKRCKTMLSGRRKSENEWNL